jgi:hypothetical protein
MTKTRGQKSCEAVSLIQNILFHLIPTNLVYSTAEVNLFVPELVIFLLAAVSRIILTLIGRANNNCSSKTSTPS